MLTLLFARPLLDMNLRTVKKNTNYLASDIGVPQGSILGPLPSSLFFFVNLGIGKKPLSLGCYKVLYWEP